MGSDAPIFNSRGLLQTIIKATNQVRFSFMGGKTVNLISGNKNSNRMGTNGKVFSWKSLVFIFNPFTGGNRKFAEILGE